MPTDERELKDAIAGILHSGLVCLRGSAGRNADYVRVEADHLHNLPWCIARMRDDDIRHYHETERPRYLEALRRLGDAAPLAPSHERHWAVIEAHLRRSARGDVADR